MLKEALFQSLDEALGKKYSIVSSYVFKKNTIAFFAVKPYKDNWNSHLKLIIFRPDGQWYAAELNGVWGLPWFGGIVVKPRHQLMFVTENGSAYTAVGGYPLTHQGNIPNSRADLNTSDLPALFFHNAKSIHGEIYAVNNLRVVVKYENNKWIHLKNGLSNYEDLLAKEDQDYGFSDIDGFSDRDIYAGGDNGDLWHWNGEIWRQIDCPTNACLKNICCGDDGLVYITMNKNAILCGRGDKWEFINQDVTDSFESIVWFKDRIYLSSSYQLFQIKDKKFSAANEGEFRSLMWGKLSVGDGIMVAALDRRVGIFDGEKWTIVSEGKKVPWQQD